MPMPFKKEITIKVSVALLCCVAKTLAHMPTFKDYSDCVFQDDASTQSMAIYTRIPARATLICSFLMNDINEELQLSISMPVSHYRKLSADNLLFSIYAHGVQEWTPQCKSGWNGWHGSSSDLNNKVAIRIPLNESTSDRKAVFEPWGVGGYIPIIGCSTQIAQQGARHFISISNTNDHEVRVCVGVGTKEEHFKSFVTWLKLKWSFSLWRTWEWGLARGAFLTVVAFAALSNVYILCVFLYRIKPHWFYWFGNEIGQKDGAECGIDMRDLVESDKIVDASGFIMLFWISGVSVVWLVVFFISYADVNGEHTNGPKLIRFQNAMSPLIYAYTLPVLLFLVLYAFVRYSFLWQWFWMETVQLNASAVVVLLIFDILIAAAFDSIYPFSYFSAAVCVYCLWHFFLFLIDGRRFCPSVSSKMQIVQCNVPTEAFLHNQSEKVVLSQKTKPMHNYDISEEGGENTLKKLKTSRHAATGWVI